MSQNYCDGIPRRNFIQAGLGGLGLAELLRAQANAATGSRPAKSCIFIWMDGGPSHYEPFDPKPSAPAEIRGIFNTIPTNVEGVTFSEHVPLTAQVMDRLTIIRSIAHHDPGHGGGNHYLTTGRATPMPVACGAKVSFHPSIGSVIAKELRAKDGIPPYVQFALPGPLRSGGPNFLGAKYAPFYVSNNPNQPGFRMQDVTLPPGVNDRRASRRELLRRDVDTLQRITDSAANDPAAGLDSFYQQAVELITSPAAKRAFDIHRESREVRDAYGRTMVGQQCLLARRLVEAGVPFVIVQHAGWDHHANIFEYLKGRYLPIFDQAFSTLIKDLDERGLLEDTLVVALGEFGRTPKINKNGGRDHWPQAMSVAAAGPGVPRGHIIGATDSKGAAPAEGRLSVEDFASTLFTKMGIDPTKIYHDALGRPLPIVEGGKPIADLV
ncbi:MAG: DUF1501 domain-containing protein [Planctomycetota bacterium]|nr:DUF1501 domain-containing protein [Planctomycetota bacterium]